MALDTEITVFLKFERTTQIFYSYRCKLGKHAGRVV